MKKKIVLIIAFKFCRIYPVRNLYALGVLPRCYRLMLIAVHLRASAMIVNQSMRYYNVCTILAAKLSILQDIRIYVYIYMYEILNRL